MNATTTVGPRLEGAAPLTRIIDAALARAGGWLPFDRFMALALYAPGLGYYANESAKFGPMPESGSDFVTAPELTPLFGQALAVQVGEALEQTGTDTVWEFGAGSGALAAQLLDALGKQVKRYRIVDLSGTLRARQRVTLERFGDKVEWLSALPDDMQGVVVGNEVLDAMPVQLLHRVKGQWFERGVVAAGLPMVGDQVDGGSHGNGGGSETETEIGGGSSGGGNGNGNGGGQADAETDPARWAWRDRPTDLRPPVEPEGPQDYLSETHRQGEAFIATLADRLTKGAAFFIDYGFPESEYYHPQRHMGTLMCHRAHRADPDPLADVGRKDITAHVNFTGIALAGQDAGLEVLGYTSQARFLINCGLLSKAEQQSQSARGLMAVLIHEHEMGELFKVIGFAVGQPWEALGFANGDRSHTL